MKTAARKTSAPGRQAGKARAKPVSEKKQESKEIERAVYDGMQDLRVKKSR